MARLATLGTGVVLLACAGGTDSTEPTEGASTSFARIQAQVFTTSCGFAACHAPGNTSGSGLVLSGSGAYAALVNAMPMHSTARSDGLRLVRPGKPDSSLLWHKINGFAAGHHARDYGAPMPYSGPPLPAGQVEFIRQWILSGASATSDDINPSLLTATSAPVPYTPLAAPASGFQVRVPAFDVAAGKEREIFRYASVGNASEVWVNRIQTQMRSGSHHFVLFTFAANTPGLAIPAPNEVRDLKDANGNLNYLTLFAMPYHVFFSGAQTTESDYTFPAGVAIRLRANAMLDANAHYVNSTGFLATGEAEANLHTVPAASVQSEAQPLNLVNTDLTIPAGRDTTITRTFTFNRLTRVVMLTSHMHKRGLKFVVKIAGGPRNGEIVYQSNAWDHPPITSFTTPLTLTAGQGLTSEVTFRGDPTRVVRFGLTADDEMNIIFGYWY
jgi:hypothetical protein